MARRLREEPEAFDLPSRLSLFGHTRIAATEMTLLEAIAAHRDVHLWLPHPSPAAWDALADLRGPVPRSSDDLAPADPPPAAEVSGS